MVSSKCCQVESPSPFRFFAALIPPCAQTECERFTGTIENRSTLPPISAILITAARPARPPPITIIFGFDAISLRFLLLFEQARFCLFHDAGAYGIDRLFGKAGAHRIQGCETDCAHEQEKGQAHSKKSGAGGFSGDDAPLGEEEPDAVGEVPRSGDQADHVEDEQRRVIELLLYFAEGCAGMDVEVDAGEAHRPSVPKDVSECDAASPALGGVHPVAGPGVVGDASFAAIPDVKAVQAVESDGEPNSEQFQCGY